MSTSYIPYEPRQQQLLPCALQDWLPEGHLAYFISETIDELDLSAFHARYAKGGPRNHPNHSLAISAPTKDALSEWRLHLKAASGWLLSVILADVTGWIGPNRPLADRGSDGWLSLRSEILRESAHSVREHLDLAIAAPASVSLLADWVRLELASFGMGYTFACNHGAEKISC